MSIKHSVKLTIGVLPLLVGIVGLLSLLMFTIDGCGAKPEPTAKAELDGGVEIDGNSERIEIKGGDMDSMVILHNGERLHTSEILEQCHARENEYAEDMHRVLVELEACYKAKDAKP